MLKLRLLTAIILIPLVLFGLYKTSLSVFWAVLLFCGLTAGFEWLQLIPLNKIGPKIGFLLALALACYSIQFVYGYWLMLGLILWFVLAYLIIFYPKSEPFWGKSWLVAAFGLLLIPLFVQSLVALFKLEEGRLFIIYLLFLVWVADSAAYFAGKLWGCHKLIPNVSPGKTIEGMAGGLLLSILIGFVGYYFFQPNSAVLWYLFILFMYFVTVMGDLFISMLKRRVRLKDTGHLFPGHGGILDRLDSLIAASPFFYAGLILFLNGI